MAWAAARVLRCRLSRVPLRWERAWRGQGAAVPACPAPGRASELRERRGDVGDVRSAGCDDESTIV